MTTDKFGHHILQNHIDKFHPLKKYQCGLYIHGKGKGSQNYQKSPYTFILQNNSVVYKVPIKVGVVDNVVSCPEVIFYHYNKSPQHSIKRLIGQRIFKEDTLLFTSIKKKTDDQLFIEITVTCE